MALTTIQVHGEILDPDGLTPAVGTVTFTNRVELRDTVANVVYEPARWVATLDVNGEFTITLPVTDNPDITPLNWTYGVYVSTTQWREAFSIELPAALGPVAEFADLIPLDDPDTCTPDGTACAPISLVGQVETLQAEVDDILVSFVVSVNGESGIVILSAADVGADPAGSAAAVDALLHASDASWITSGTLDYRRLGGIIAENLSVVFGRATLVSPGTAADVWQWQYNGTRVTYINEYSCLRVRGIPDNQVPARFMSHNTRDGTPLATFQVGLSDAVTMLFQVLANGDILAPGGLSMLPSAYQPVSFNGTTASAALISDGANTGAPYTLGTTLHAAANRVYMEGAVANTGGVAIAGGTVLFTIAAAHKPTAWVQFNERTSTTLSARVTIRPDGTVRLDQSLAPLATVSFDGLNWRKN